MYALSLSYSYNNKHLSELAPHHGGKETADIDMVGRN